MNIELIFGLTQAIVTAIAGVIFHKTKIPNRYIPIQNIIIGIIAGLLATYFKLYDDLSISIVLCLATSLGVGGLYDAVQIPNKNKEVKNILQEQIVIDHENKEAEDDKD